MAKIFLIKTPEFFSSLEKNVFFYDSQLSSVKDKTKILCGWCPCFLACSFHSLTLMCTFSLAWGNVFCTGWHSHSVMWRHVAHWKALLHLWSFEPLEPHKGILVPQHAGDPLAGFPETSEHLHPRGLLLWEASPPTHSTIWTPWGPRNLIKTHLLDAEEKWELKS